MDEEQAFHLSAEHDKRVKMKLKKKIAVITGGNSGIGYAIAEEFKAEGAFLVIFGRDREALVKAEGRLGSNTLAVQGDVTDMADLNKLYRATVDRFGKIDILVANAGIARIMSFDAVDEYTFDSLVDVNFKGTFFTVQKALPFLRDGASIVLISSALQSKGLPGFTVYSATKAAIRSLARTLSAELLDRGIRVNVISPGPIDTPLFDKYGFSTQELSEIKKSCEEGVPLRRFGSPKEIAKAVVFLGSSDSSYIVGEEILIEGGQNNL
jgi:NAD(P)-dependent dehydrogenase (short-subunit alcohol dehydrogenase family)